MSLFDIIKKGHVWKVGDRRKIDLRKYLWVGPNGLKIISLNLVVVLKYLDAFLYSLKRLIPVLMRCP